MWFIVHHSVNNVGATIGRPYGTMLRIRRNLGSSCNLILRDEQCSPLHPDCKRSAKLQFTT